MPSLTSQYVPVSSRHGGFLYWDWFSPLDSPVQVLGSDLVPRPDMANLSLSLPMVTHTTEDAITTNCTNVLTYKRNTLHYISSLLQKERLLQKDQCHNLQKVHFVLQKDTPRGCHHLPVCRIRRRHDATMVTGYHTTMLPRWQATILQCYLGDRPQCRVVVRSKG